MPKVDQDKCAGCGICVNVCPVNAISMVNNKAVIDQDKCIHCGKCIPICPVNAIIHNHANQNSGKAHK